MFAGFGDGLDSSDSNTSWPLPGQDMIDHAGGSCAPEHPMIVVRTAEAAEQALTEGQLVCPAADVATPCGGGDMDGAGMCAASARR